MAIVTLYKVLDNKGEEVLVTEDKKYADWYDKRIESGYALLDFVKENKDEVPDKLLKNESELEDLILFLAKHPNKVTKILKASKDFSDVLKDEPFDEYNKK